MENGNIINVALLEKYTFCRKSAKIGIITLTPGQINLMLAAAEMNTHNTHFLSLSQFN
jgi:ethanolamine utilization microcompartment shell protein EutS